MFSSWRLKKCAFEGKHNPSGETIHVPIPSLNEVLCELRRRCVLGTMSLETAQPINGIDNKNSRSYVVRVTKNDLVE